MKFEEEDILREAIAINQRNDASQYRCVDGWYSTSIVPELGRLFRHVYEGNVIKFKAGSLSEREGIVYAVHYGITSALYFLEVYAYEYQIMGDEKEVKKYTIPMPAGSIYEKIRYDCAK